MPTIDELMGRSKKKFKKSDYRPWNYMDEIESETRKDDIEINKGSYGNQLDINNVHAESTVIKENATVTHHAAIIEDPEVSFNTQEENIAVVKDYETALEVIFRLTGHQKVIFNFIVEYCISRELLRTNAIKGEALATLCGTSLKMVKTSIQRIVAKGLIERGKGKTGRGGFYTFKITDLVKKAAVDCQNANIFDNQLEIKRESNENHKSQPSYSKHNSTFNSKNILTEEWANIDFELLKEIGFSETQLMQLQDKTNPDLVQESIRHFAYGLSHIEKYKKYADPLNVLMGVLRKGQAWYEKNYKSEQEIAMEQILEQRRIRREREIKLKEDVIAAQFEDWFEELPEEEKISIAKNFNVPAPMHKVKSVIRAKYFEYFKERVLDKN